MRSPFWYISILLAAALALASCHKDTGESGPRLVESMTIDGNDCEIGMLYDSEDRITSLTQCDTVELYTYYEDSVVYERRVAGGISYRDIYRLGEDGLAHGFTHIASDGSITDNTISYDADHYRTGLVDNTHLSTYIYYTIKDENVQYDSSASGLIASGRYTISRTFYASTENTLSNENYGRTFLGKSSENFKKTESYNTPDGQYTIRYYYELDHLNGVSRRIMKINDSIIETRDYEYYDGDD